MIAFGIEVTLLLAAVFLLALAAGYWLAAGRRAPGDLPVDEARTVTPPPAAAPQPMPSAEPPPQAAAPAGTSADLFTRLGIADGIAALPPEDESEEEEAPRPAPLPAATRRKGVENHPGRRPPAIAAPEGEGPDDLKLLKGIGPQNERRLNALGIFHFRQIALWTPEEAAWVGSYLAFPGRIEREDWIGQAKTILDGGAPPPAPGRRKR